MKGQTAVMYLLLNIAGNMLAIMILFIIASL